MAKHYNNSMKSYKGKSKFTKEENLAYDLGRIQAVVTSKKDCKVRDSYEKGLKSGDQEKKTKKTLF